MTFRSKLLASIVAVVGATTGATLFIAQDQTGEAYRTILDGLFRSQIESFESLQEQRLEVGRNQARVLSGSVRLFAALEENDPELIYEVADVELREADFDFYRVANAKGEIIPAAVNSGAGHAGADVESHIAAVLKSASSNPALRDQTHLGFFVDGAKEGAEGEMLGVVSAGIMNQETSQFAGTLILGKKIVPMRPGKQTQGDRMIPALFLNDAVWSPHMSRPMRESLKRALQSRSSHSIEEEKWKPTLNGASYRTDTHLLNPGSIFPAAQLVTMYPLEGMFRSQRALLRRVAMIAVSGLLAAAGVGLIFAHRLSNPVRDLVRGTAEIKQGNYDVRVPKSTTDELGALADAFNEMAAGLALKEKYRSVLQLVTDRSVADELMSGAVQLGGETREVSVIFCDIRGFTALSQGMPPADVVAMLNEHMSALTHVVHEHRGVVDKFVGDAVMTLFGAPKSYGQDAVSAVRCAWGMIREREKLNTSSGRTLLIGIGIATGPALAGCMGSEQRLNYTVIGERVNLAARLCSQAGPMDIIIDEATRAALPSGFQTEPMGSLTLKGFSDPVPAHRVISVPS